MSGGSLLEACGHSLDVDDYVVALAFLDRGRRLVAVLAEGGLRVMGPDASVEEIEVDGGSLLSAVATPDGRSLFLGSDDGRVLRYDLGTREATPVASAPGAWIEHLDCDARGGLLAFAAGKVVRVVQTADGKEVRRLEHPSSVGGLAFEGKGRRLAVAHYGGVSLWWAAVADRPPQHLAWKGSHLGVTWSPDSRFLVTSMQEAALHGWRLEDSADMRMAGYPSKIKSFSWMAGGRLLATSGADQVIAWPFTGRQGPMGKSPEQLGWTDGRLVTLVAAHPKGEVCAFAIADGDIHLGQRGKAQDAIVRRNGGAEVTALVWSPDGRRLAFADEAGEVGIVDLPA